MPNYFTFPDRTLVAMLPMKLLTSSCVGQDFWQGASAHLRQRPASLRAARSLSVVCFTSSKFLKSVEHELREKCKKHIRQHFVQCNSNLSFRFSYPQLLRFFSLSSFLFQCFLFFFVAIDGTAFANSFVRGFSAS